MFEKFTDRSRMVMALAEQLARELNHCTLSTGHILWGLARESAGVARHVLDVLEVDAAAIKKEVISGITPFKMPLPEGKVPLGGMATDVVQRASGKALSLHHNYVGTEHLLLAILDDQESVAAQIIKTLNVDPEAIREGVLDTLGIEPGPLPEGDAAYERFTDRARKAMHMAQQEAQRFCHEYIGTEHILLGLIKDGSGTAANVLKNLNVDPRKIRLEVEKVMVSGPEKVTMGRLPQTPGAKSSIQHAIQAARDQNADHIGTEHLLLGVLMAEKEMGHPGGVCAIAIAAVGLTHQKIAAELETLTAKKPTSGETDDQKAGNSTSIPKVDDMSKLKVDKCGNVWTITIITSEDRAPLYAMAEETIREWPEKGPSKSPGELAEKKPTSVETPEPKVAGPRVGEPEGVTWQVHLATTAPHTWSAGANRTFEAMKEEIARASEELKTAKITEARGGTVMRPEILLELVRSATCVVTTTNHNDLNGAATAFLKRLFESATPPLPKS